MGYPVFQPFLGPEELEACRCALDTKYLGMGSLVGEFEEALSRTLELDFEHRLVAFSTGHAALHAALIALGVGPGDEVVTPSFNNIADFQAISAVGAQPVFCDVEDETLCIDPAAIDALITDRTRAIIAMDYGAVLADTERVGEIAAARGLTLIHDAAHSFGSKVNDKPVGQRAPITMFSFDPIKNVTCIDGGALVFQDETLLETFHAIRLIGMGQRATSSYNNKRDWGYDVHQLGFRYHLANLHAAIGLSQLRKLDEISRRRRSLYQAYHRRFAAGGLVRTQGPLRDGVVPFIMCVRVPAELRGGLKEHLATLDIETGLHWRPGHLFSYYSECVRGDLSVTDRISKEIVSLPFYPDLTVDDVNYICDQILEFFAANPWKSG